MRKEELDRFRMFKQGEAHREYGLGRQWIRHEHLDDYLDGLHGRRFTKVRKRSMLQKIQALFGKS